MFKLPHTTQEKMTIVYLLVVACALLLERSSAGNRTFIVTTEEPATVTTEEPAFTKDQIINISSITVSAVIVIFFAGLVGMCIKRKQEVHKRSLEKEKERDNSNPVLAALKEKLSIDPAKKVKASKMLAKFSDQLSEALITAMASNYELPRHMSLHNLPIEALRIIFKDTRVIIIKQLQKCGFLIAHGGADNGLGIQMIQSDAEVPATTLRLIAENMLIELDAGLKDKGRINALAEKGSYLSTLFKKVKKENRDEAINLLGPAVEAEDDEHQNQAPGI
jgi:hypothetical protein